MIISHEAILAAADAIQDCAATATDESGIAVVFRVSDEAAYRAVLTALTSLPTTWKQNVIFPSNFAFCAKDGFFPAGAKAKDLTLLDANLPGEG